MTLPGWITKIIAIWTGLGTLSIVLGANGVSFLDWLLPFLAPEFIHATEIVLGAVVAYINIIKGMRATKSSGVEVKSLSTDKKLWYAVNPFAL